MSSKKKTEYAPLSTSAIERLEPYRDLMGKRPDGEIAKLAGLDRRYVVVFRIHNDIPPYRRGSAAKLEAQPTSAKPRRFRKSKLDEFRHLMGEVPDGRIAELAGCSREAVMRYRKRFDIPPAPRGRAAEPPVKVRPPAPPVVEPEPAAPAVVAAPEPDDDLPPELDEVLTDDHIEPAELSEDEEPEPEPEPEPEAPPVSEGFLVTALHDGEQHEWMVLSTDLAQAASSAMQLVETRTPGAQIIEIRYCADLL